MHTLSAPSPTPPTADATALRLAAARARVLDLVARVDADDLTRVHDPLMSPLVWDLGHIAAFADLWLSRRPNARPALHPELFRVYDADETPRADRGTLPMLGVADALVYLDAIQDRALEALEQVTAGPDGGLTADDIQTFGLIAEHEEQHTETMLQCLQLACAGTFAPHPSTPGRPTPPHTAGAETIEIDADAHKIGAGTGFSYDNERPAHRVELPGFTIARQPVTNGQWRAFVDDDGYTTAQWWTAAGWAWRSDHGVSRPQYWNADLTSSRVFDRHVPLDADAPVIHVSAHEADAYAAWSGTRLPTEFEWEAAAAAGTLDGAGQVWEWTSSTFSGYPGFIAHPYREYSEVFFGRGYRVLRGGSWASSVATRRRTFRNWDLPQRRQIFAGLRLATRSTNA